MSLLKKISAPKMIAIAVPALALVFCALPFGRVFAGGPILKNVNPQGTVTSASAKITLDTEDLARCRYSISDTGYDSMGNDMDTPDGLEHSATLGSLSKGSYTYYVRCKDFEGNANDSSKEVKFSVGEISCVGENCPTIPSGGSGPKLTGLLPKGTLYTGYTTLSVNTDVPAECRYSWLDKDYESMTLPPFSSSNKLYHTAPVVLSNLGYYVAYVRCKSDGGAVNQVAGKISFRYASNVPYVPPVDTTPKTPADAAPPVISELSPIGEVIEKKVEISCVTDEAAHCKFGTADAGYDELTDKFEVPGSIVSLDPAGTSHKKTVDLDEPGEYNYYVRCQDEKGNKNTVATKISFTYVLPEGPKITDAQPVGTIYQSSAALMVSTDKTATCRYSIDDIDFDDMGDSFDTSDGTLHQAMIDLPDYDDYVYFVRCADNDGNKTDESEMISFTFENPNPEEEAAEEATTTPPACETVALGDKDGQCDNTADCLCDPDCPESGDDADGDCANVVKSSNNSWVAVLFIFLILLIVAAIIIIIMRRRGAQEEDVELP